jgi:hypothetical protein
MNIKHPMVGNRKPTPGAAQPQTVQNQQPRVFTVAPPEDERHLEPEQSFDSVYESQENPLNSIEQNDELFRRQAERREVMNKLVFLRNSHVRTVTLDGTKFTIKILAPTENARISSMLKDIPEAEQLSKIATIMVSAAIVDVDGIRLEDVYSGPSTTTDPIMQKYYEISQWPAPLVNSLFSEYNNFLRETEERYSPDFLKQARTQSSDSSGGSQKP